MFIYYWEEECLSMAQLEATSLFLSGLIGWRRWCHNSVFPFLATIPVNVGCVLDCWFSEGGAFGHGPVETCPTSHPSNPELSLLQLDPWSTHSWLKVVSEWSKNCQPCTLCWSSAEALSSRSHAHIKGWERKLQRAQVLVKKCNPTIKKNLASPHPT